MKYGNVIKHIFKGEEYMFRYNYIHNHLEMVVKLDEEEHEEMMREVDEEMDKCFFYGVSTPAAEALAEDVDSYNETGYVAGNYSWQVTEEDFLKNPDTYMDGLCYDAYKEAELINQYGY